VAATLIVPVVDEGLGNSAYLVDLGDGRALAVDVPRDLRAVRAAARRHGLTVACAADTHLHADFLSGAVQLAARLPEENRRGPAVLATAPTLGPLTTGKVRTLQNEGGQVIDVRPVADYAAGHILGSLAIPLRGALA
jgi:glyoxylase-like metal-dependent hydrolase (beta-lactamase superfamily II)